jgi:hypothetical protein
MSLITGINASLILSNPNPAQGIASSNVTMKIKSWSVNRTNAVKSSATSLSGGYKETSKGISDWKLSFVVFCDTSGRVVGVGGPTGNAITLSEGDLVTLNKATVSSAIGQFFSGTARVESIDEPVEVDGDNLAVTVNCAGHLAYNLT